jgi:hypothetical protein
MIYPLTHAQECQFYYPQTKGAELVYNNYDKKGKLTGTSSQKVIEYNKTANGAEATILVKSADDKGKNVTESQLKVKCESGVFYFDMKGYLQQNMSAYEGMEVKMDFQNLEMPSNLKAGDKLKDGWIKMEISNAGIKLMTMEIDITNRTVEGKESITTAAGTFDCYKLKQNISTQMGMKFEAKSTQWMNPGTGMIKSESYSTDNILTSSTVLEKINK